VDALRLLDVSRQVFHATVTALWPQLDAFGTRESTYADQQVTALIDPVIGTETANGTARRSKLERS
jgi:hypothetical protein